MNIFGGLLFLILFIWYRFVRERIPIELNHNINFLQSVIFFIILITILISLYQTITKLINPKKNANISDFFLKNKIILITTNIILFFILKIKNNLIALDVFIKNNVIRYNQQMSYIDKFCLDFGLYLFYNYKISINLLLSLYFIPESILCLCFGIDILIYQNFYYLYKVLWLVLFTFLSKYIIYSIEVFIEINLEKLNSIIVILECDLLEKKKFRIIDVYTFTETRLQNADKYYSIIFKKEYIEEKNLFNVIKHNNLLQEIDKFLEKVCLIKTFLNSFTKHKIIFELYFNIIKYSLYSICWFYIIFYGLSWLF